MKKQNNVIIGIYKITNPKGKVYIGQSLNVNKRKKYYTRPNQIKNQPKIHNSLQKYGFENHIFEIIEECSIEQLNERETYWKQYYLDFFKGCWELVLFCNLYDSGGGPKSEEHKRKIGEGNKGKTISEEGKKKISEAHLGVKRTDDTKYKISQAKKGYKYSKESSIKKSQSLKGRRKTKEHRQNISKSKGFSVLQCKMNGIIVREYNSIKEAAVLNNYSPTPIQNCCHNKIKNYKGYIWKFKNN
jgi:group I intron endonuclease